MVERLMAQETIGAVDRYRMSGGILDKRSIDKAQGVLLALVRGEELEPVKKTCLLQADHWSKVCQIPITPEQKYLYATLRDDMPVESDENVNLSSGDIGTLPAWKLGDRELFIQVNILTDVIGF